MRRPVSLGASPRAAVDLMFVAKAIAAIEGRYFVVPDDVKAARCGVAPSSRPQARSRSRRADHRPGGSRNSVRAWKYPSERCQPSDPGNRRVEAAIPAGRFDFAFGPRFYLLLLLGLSTGSGRRGPTIASSPRCSRGTSWRGDLGVRPVRLPKPDQLHLRRVWNSPLALAVPAALTIGHGKSRHRAQWSPRSWTMSPE